MARMQRLDLDFVARRRASPWVGRVLLAAAATVTADMGLQFYDLQAINSQYKVEFAKVGPRSGRPVKATSAEEVAAARETVQRLSLPWTKLFDAVESAASEQVALTAIEPDPRAGTVKITGDSKDYLAALTYVLNLSRAEGLSSVQLVRHEVRQGSVGFTISASWKAARS
ncbi:MAG TPA: PilN domain-containing protein [Burkholderiales bacterium]|nr:PilN domain-containing protein [Burkholderiales bacterium]